MKNSAAYAAAHVLISALHFFPTSSVLFDCYLSLFREHQLAAGPSDQHLPAHPTGVRLSSISGEDIYESRLPIQAQELPIQAQNVK